MSKESVFILFYAGVMLTMLLVRHWKQERAEAAARKESEGETHAE